MTSVTLTTTTTVLLLLWVVAQADSRSPQQHRKQRNPESTQRPSPSSSSPPPSSSFQGAEFSHPSVHRRLWNKITMRPMQFYSPCDDVRNPTRKGAGIQPSLNRALPNKTSTTTTSNSTNDHHEDDAVGDDDEDVNTWCYLHEEFSMESLKMCNDSKADTFASSSRGGGGSKNENTKNNSSGSGKRKSSSSPSDSRPHAAVVVSAEKGTQPYSALTDCPRIQRVVCGYRNPLLSRTTQRANRDNGSSGVVTTTQQRNTKKDQVDERDEDIMSKGMWLPMPNTTMPPQWTTGGNKKKRRARRREKGKALVLYMMHTWDREDKLAEWDNFAFFWELGLLPEGQETQLFSQVDFVFYRIHPEVSRVQLCSQHGNIRFLWVPPGPCDLCAHGRVLQALGLEDEDLEGDLLSSTSSGDKQNSNNTNSSGGSTFSGVSGGSSISGAGGSPWPYKSVILMNSGVRGPFTHRLSASWVDIVSIGRPEGPVGGVRMPGGRGLRSPVHHLGRSRYHSAEDAKSFRTVFAVSLNLVSLSPKFRSENNKTWEQVQPHAQSYFLVVPVGLLPAYYLTLLNTCGIHELYYLPPVVGGGGNGGGVRPRSIGWQRRIDQATKSDGIIVGAKYLKKPRRGGKLGTKIGSFAKLRCIKVGESQTLELARSNKGIVYFSLIRTVLGGDLHDKNQLSADYIHHFLVKKQGIPITTTNTNKYYNDPCRGIFVKFGGNVMDRNKMQVKTLQSVNRLTAWIRSSMTSGKRFQQREQAEEERRSRTQEGRTNINSTSSPDFGFWLRQSYNNTRCQWFREPRIAAAPNKTPRAASVEKPSVAVQSKTPQEDAHDDGEELGWTDNDAALNALGDAAAKQAMSGSQQQQHDEEDGELAQESSSSSPKKVNGGKR